jgi:ABC-type uncharacterized transport system involved in gliding motility auxiliary subunit
MKLQRILGIIGWIGTALVFGAFIFSYLRDGALRSLPPEADVYRNYATWAGLVLVLVYLAGQWREVADFYKTRNARYGTMTLVAVLVFGAILVAVNYLASRQNKRWDLTANQIYSLSDQTVRILRELDSPVKFTVYDQELNFDRSRGRIDSYVYQSPRVSAEYVDVDKNPTRAKAAQVQSYGTIVVEYKDRTERVTSTNEQDLTNALIKAVTGAQKKVYFTSGHGEKDTATGERSGYTGVGQALGSDNYGVEKLVLIQKQEVPADATVLVIAGPRTDFLQPEIDALKKYVARGGKVLALIDPPDKAADPDLPLLQAFLREWGIAVGKDVVLDASGIGRLFGADASVPVAASYPAHPITDNFGVMTAFPFARSVAPVEGGTGGHIAQAIVETGPQSWAESDFASLATGQVEFNADKGDKQGPVRLGAAVSAPATEAPPPPSGNASPDKPDEGPKPETRIVSIGDSDFASNAALGIQGNRDFFMNTVNWLAQQENLIAIRPREPEDRRLTLTADQQQRIMLLSIFIIPGLVFASGIYSWWRRR